MGAVKTIFSIFMNDPWSFVLLAVIMVSALIVFLGLWKPLFKKFIPNEKLRCSALGFASIVLSFASVAVAFWVHDWNFAYYLWVALAFSVCTVFVYWLYETTHLRDGIHWLGSFVLKKFSGLDIKNLTDLKNYLQNSTPAIAEEAEVTLKATAKTVANTVDKELKNL